MTRWLAGVALGLVVALGVVGVIGGFTLVNDAASNAAQTKGLVQAIRDEQKQNTGRVQNAAQTKALVLAVRSLLEHDHDKSYPVIVAIYDVVLAECRATPGCHP